MVLWERCFCLCLFVRQCCGTTWACVGCSFDLLVRACGIIASYSKLNHVWHKTSILALKNPSVFASMLASVADLLLMRWQQTNWLTANIKECQYYLQGSNGVHEAEQRMTSTRKALQDHMEFDAEKVTDTDYM